MNVELTQAEKAILKDALDECEESYRAYQDYLVEESRMKMVKAALETVQSLREKLLGEEIQV